MLLQRSWFIFIYCFLLTCQGLNAQQSATHKEACNAVAHRFSIAENIFKQLNHQLHSNKLMQWVSSGISASSQRPQRDASIALYLPYRGKTIGLIRLEKHGVWRLEQSRWNSLVSILFPTTKDSVILNELSFVPGDTIIPHQLLASQERLNKLSFIKEANIAIQVCHDSKDAADLHITIQDQLPIGIGLDAHDFGLSITHNNLNGWGHILENKLVYNKGLGYGIKYRAPNINNTGITGELQYLHTPRKKIQGLQVFRGFDDQTDHAGRYAGKIALSKTRNVKSRILDGSTKPQKVIFSFHRQCVWLGTTAAIDASNTQHQGRFFFTGKAVHQHFVNRPAVAKGVNRYFHHYTFGLGSIGFANKKHYEDRLVYGVGAQENIAYGRKINLIGGYQIGEFADRPYLRLDMAQGGRMRQLGYLYSAIQVGGFWHNQAIEQGTLQLKLDYFTPLLKVGHQWLRQFVRLDYLGGYNMFTGELISTHMHKGSTDLKDPFPGGTKRVYLGLETALLMSRNFAGYQVATLGFLEGIRLQDAQGRVKQSSLCKVLGLGIRCAHSKSLASVLQIKLGYAPLTQSGYWSINITVGPQETDLDIGEPDTILFR
ncbi:MAG: hypothetical protein ACX93T_01490 [Bacteroidota bacterium]